MKTAIRKMGNSHGVIIPKPLLAEVGAKANDQVNLGVENGRIVIAPIRKRPRAGWVSPSRSVAARLPATHARASRAPPRVS